MQPLLVKVLLTTLLVIPLVWLTRPIDESRADDGGGQREQGLMNVESPLKSDSQLSKPSKPRVRALYNPTVLVQSLTAFNPSPCDPAQDAFGPQIGPATAVVIAFVCVQFLRTLARPARPLSAGKASMQGSNSMESCRLAPLTRITNEMPRASTTMCRLDPNFPLSVGLGPVC